MNLSLKSLGQHLKHLNIWLQLWSRESVLGSFVNTQAAVVCAAEDEFPPTVLQPQPRHRHWLWKQHFSVTAQQPPQAQANQWQHASNWSTLLLSVFCLGGAQLSERECWQNAPRVAALGLVVSDVTDRQGPVETMTQGQIFQAGGRVHPIFLSLP